MNIIENDWMHIIEREMNKKYYGDLMNYLKDEKESYTIYPREEDIFNALHYTPLSRVKVVIIGQDPYHNENQAHGLCFSVKPQVDIPPSLRNIYKELKEDLGYDIPTHGFLKKWADQGVLMLNSVLTVRAHQAGSHKGKGWEVFTDYIIQTVNKEDRPIVFLLWGNPAKEKKKLLNNPKHLVIEAAHPSPLSAFRGFFGSRPFSQTNEFLKNNQVEPIDWRIETVTINE